MDLASRKSERIKEVKTMSNSRRATPAKGGEGKEKKKNAVKGVWSKRKLTPVNSTALHSSEGVKKRKIG